MPGQLQQSLSISRMPSDAMDSAPRGCCRRSRQAAVSARRAFKETVESIKPTDGVIMGIRDRYSDQPAECAVLVRKSGEGLRQSSIDRSLARRPPASPGRPRLHVGSVSPSADNAFGELLRFHDDGCLVFRPVLHLRDVGFQWPCGGNVLLHRLLQCFLFSMRCPFHRLPLGFPSVPRGAFGGGASAQLIGCAVEQARRQIHRPVDAEAAALPGTHALDDLLD